MILWHRPIKLNGDLIPHTLLPLDSGKHLCTVTCRSSGSIEDWFSLRIPNEVIPSKMEPWHPLTELWAENRADTVTNNTNVPPLFVLPRKGRKKCCSNLFSLNFVLLVFRTVCRLSLSVIINYVFLDRSNPFPITWSLSQLPCVKAGYNPNLLKKKSTASAHTKFKCRW